MPPKLSQLSASNSLKITNLGAKWVLGYLRLPNVLQLLTGRLYRSSGPNDDLIMFGDDLWGGGGARRGFLTGRHVEIFWSMLALFSIIFLFIFRDAFLIVFGSF
mgnify:CR=1 FL=1